MSVLGAPLNIVEPDLPGITTNSDFVNTLTPVTKEAIVPLLGITWAKRGLIATRVQSGYHMPLC